MPDGITTDREACGWIYMQAGRQIDKKTDGKIERDSRRAGRQADRHL